MDNEEECPFVAHLTLFRDEAATSAAMTSEGSRIPGTNRDNTSHASEQPLQLLYGTLVASSYKVYEDDTGRTRNYFVFPDVAVSRPGFFKLGVSCSRLSA